MSERTLKKKTKKNPTSYVATTTRTEQDKDLTKIHQDVEKLWIPSSPEEGETKEEKKIRERRKSQKEKTNLPALNEIPWAANQFKNATKTTKMINDIANLLYGGDFDRANQDILDILGLDEESRDKWLKETYGLYPKMIFRDVKVFTMPLARAYLKSGVSVPNPPPKAYTEPPSQQQEAVFSGQPRRQRVTEDDEASQATQFTSGETFTFPQPAIQSYQPEDTSNIAGPAGPADEPSQELDPKFEERVDAKLQYIRGLGAYNIRNKQILDIPLLQKTNERGTPQPIHLHYLCNIILKTLKRNGEIDYARDLPSNTDEDLITLDRTLNKYFGEYVTEVLHLIAGDQELSKQQFEDAREILLHTIAIHIVLNEDKEKARKDAERDARVKERADKQAREAKWKAIMEADKAAERERKRKIQGIAEARDEEKELIKELRQQRNELRAKLGQTAINDEEEDAGPSDRRPQQPSALDPLFSAEMNMVLTRNMLEAARDSIPLDWQGQYDQQQFVDKVGTIQERLEAGMIALYKETIINQQRAALVDLLFFDQFEKILDEHTDLMDNIDNVLGQFSALDVSQSFVSAADRTQLSRTLQSIQSTLQEASTIGRSGIMKSALDMADITTMESFVSAQEISFRETTDNMIIVPPSPSPARASEASPGLSSIPSAASSIQSTPLGQFRKPGQPVTIIGGNNITTDSPIPSGQQVRRRLDLSQISSSPGRSDTVQAPTIDAMRIARLQTENDNLRSQLERRQQAAIRSQTASSKLQDKYEELKQRNALDVDNLTNISQRMATQLGVVQQKLDDCEEEKVQLQEKLFESTRVALKHFEERQELMKLLEEALRDMDAERASIIQQFNDFKARKEQDLENLLALYTPRKERTRTYNQGTQSAQAGPSTPEAQRIMSQQSAATQSSPVTPVAIGGRVVFSQQSASTQMTPVMSPTLKEIKERRQARETGTQPDPVIREEVPVQTESVIREQREAQTEQIIRQTGDQASQATQGIGQQLHNELMAKLLEQRNEQIAEIQKEFADQSNVLGLSRAEVDRLQQQSVENNNRLRELQQDKQNIEGQLQGATQELLAAQDQLAQKERSRQELAARLQALEDDRPVFQARDAQQQEQIETLQIGLNDADEEITRLTDQIANLQRNLDQGAAENIRLTQELTDLQAQLRALQLRPVLTRDPNDTQMIADLQAQIRDLNLRLGMNPARAAVPVFVGPIGGGGRGPPGGGGFGGAGPSQFAIFDPSRPATRDSRDYGSQSKFARTMSRELESRNSQAAGLPLDPQGYNVESVNDFELKMRNLGIEYVDLTSDTDYLKRILAAHFAQQMSVKKALIEAARKENAWPLVYQPKFGDATTQKLKNVAFLPTKTQGRVVNSDLGTVIIPGQSNYTLRREGLNYVVHSAGKKQTFGSAQEASYFVSSGGFGRKSYGPITERVFGTPTKNLSQAIY